MANKLRIIGRNLAKLTGVAASTTSGAHLAANMLTADKSEVWRATGKSATLSGSVAASVVASCIHLPHCNLSPTATGRLRLYSDQAATAMVYDSTAKLLCPEAPAEIEGWAAADAANAYAQGGGAWGRVWFPVTTFRAWSLEISDTNNLQSSIEIANLHIGLAFSPEYDVEPGAASTVQRDTSEQFRTAAGSLKVQPGTRFDEMTLDMDMLTEVDRKAVRKLLRGHGRRVPFIVSLWPDDTDAERERAHAIYGVLTEDAEFALDGPDSFGTKLQIAQI